MVTREQLAKEEQLERQFNDLFVNVLRSNPYTAAWAQFYGVMRSAASVGEGMWKYKVCIDRTGRPIKVQRNKAGRWVVAFLKPHHEYVAKAAAQKNVKEFALHTAGMFGVLPFPSQLIQIVKQRRAKCYEMTPNDFLRKAEERNAVPKGIEDVKYEIKDSPFTDTQVVLLTATTVAILTTTAILIARTNRT